MIQPVRSETFATPGPAKLRVAVPHGRIEVTAEAGPNVQVELFAPRGDAGALAWIADCEIVLEDSEVVVRNRREDGVRFPHRGPVEARVRAPADSDATLATGSGRVETHGRLGRVSVSSGSGAVSVELCLEARVRTGSGAIDIGEAAGAVEARTGSGRVAIGKAGADVRISTGSGTARLDEAAGAARLTTGHGAIHIGRAGCEVKAATGSGNVEIRRADHGRVQARSVSGNVSVGVPAGVAALLDLGSVSGRVRSELTAAGPPAEGEPRVELALSTVSGDVSVARI